MRKLMDTEVRETSTTVDALFTPSNAKRNGMVLILLTGIIHLVLSPEYFEFALYLGLSFVANAVGAAVSAYGIYRDSLWGWLLGLPIAGGAMVMYVISRTAGLPGLPEYEKHISPIGVVTLIIEVLFIVAFFRALRGEIDPAVK